MGWSFEVFDETFKEGELTLDQYIRLEELLAVDWRSIHPLRQAKHAKNIAALMYAERSGMEFDEALTKVGQLGAVAFVDSLDLTAEDDAADPPKADASSTES